MLHELIVYRYIVKIIWKETDIKSDMVVLPVVLAIQQAERGESLEPRCSRAAWTTKETSSQKRKTIMLKFFTERAREIKNTSSLLRVQIPALHVDGSQPLMSSSPGLQCSPLASVGTYYIHTHTHRSRVDKN